MYLKLIHLFNRVNLLSPDSVSETVIGIRGYKVWEILILPEFTIWLFHAIFQCLTYERYVICSLNTSFNLSDKPMEEVELLTIIIPFLHLKTETPIQ